MAAADARQVLVAGFKTAPAAERSGRAVLRELRHLPVDRWSYRSQKPSIHHIGPIAQAFYRRFGLGESRRFIDDVDAQGVALAAIKGAAARIADQRRALVAQDRRINRLEAVVATLARR